MSDRNRRMEQMVQDQYIPESIWNRFTETLENLPEKTERKKSFSPGGITAAAVLIILIGGTAYALQMSLFSDLAEQFRETSVRMETIKADKPGNVFSDDFREVLDDNIKEYKEKAERYDSMAKESVKEEEAYSLETMLGNSIIREESYYDGTDFALAVSLDAVHYPVEYGFGPESEEFDKLWCPELTTLENIKEQEKNIADEKRSIEDNLSQLVLDHQISEEESAALKKEYEEKGRVGFVCTELYLGDHVLMGDGTDLTRCSSLDGTARYLIEPLDGITPDSVWNKEALDVVLQVKKGKRYIYIDEEGFQFLYCPPAEVELVTITLTNSIGMC